MTIWEAAADVEQESQIHSHTQYEFFKKSNTLGVTPNLMTGQNVSSQMERKAENLYQSPKQKHIKPDEKWVVAQKILHPTIHPHPLTAIFFLGIKGLAVLQLNPVVQPTEAKVIKLMHECFGRGGQIKS